MDMMLEMMVLRTMRMMVVLLLDIENDANGGVNIDGHKEK
jgi:hypothetical protein